MAAVESFMRGFTWGQGIQNAKEDREFLREERKRQSMERDAGKFIRAYTQLRGDRDATEFSESGDMDRLMMRYKDNLFVNDLVNDGVSEGKRAQLRHIGVDEETGLRSFMVDTYDKQGRLISKSRPITFGRKSREEDPSGMPLLLQSGDFHNLMIAEMAQYKEFNDNWGDARAAADTGAAMLDALYGSDDEIDAMQARLDSMGEEENTQTGVAKDSGQLLLEQEQEEQAAAQAAVDEADAETAATPLFEPKSETDLRGYNERFSDIKAEMDRLQRDIATNPPKQLDPNDYLARFEGDQEAALAQLRQDQEAIHMNDERFQSLAALRKERENVSRVREDLRRQALENPEGPVMKELAGNISTNKDVAAQRLVTDPVWQDFASSQDKKDVASAFEKGDRLANKPPSGAQNKAITKAQRDMYQAVIDGKRIDRKKMQNFIKALRVQAARGDITGDQMNASILALIKARATMQKNTGAKWKHAAVDNNLVLYNENDPTNWMHIPFPDKDGAGGSNGSDNFLTDLGKMKKVFGLEDDDVWGADSLFATFENAGIRRAGAGSAVLDAIRARRAYVASEASWYGNLSGGLIGTSEGEATQQAGMSLTPFAAMQQVGVADDGATHFFNQLQQANGGNPLTEEMWQAVAIASYKLKTGEYTNGKPLDNDQVIEILLENLPRLRAK